MIPPTPPVVLAAVAHPDDIEFLFAGTLLLLRDAGCPIHFWNLANGCLGASHGDVEETARVRRAEAATSARMAGATIHPPLFDDLAVFYDRSALARVASVVRDIRPQVILTHAFSDYMEDHQNVARLVVTAAFGRGMPGFVTDPPVSPSHQPVRIYHGAPHGLHDGLGTPFQPDLLVDVSTVLANKTRLLACHRSQKDWLETSQGMGSFESEMQSMGRAMAARGSALVQAEGWRRHATLGFCPPDFDPLVAWLSPWIQRPGSPF